MFSTGESHFGRQLASCGRREGSWEKTGLDAPTRAKSVGREERADLVWGVEASSRICWPVEHGCTGPSLRS